MSIIEKNAKEMLEAYKKEYDLSLEEWLICCKRYSKRRHQAELTEDLKELFGIVPSEIVSSIRKLMKREVVDDKIHKSIDWAKSHFKTIAAMLLSGGVIGIIASKTGGNFKK